MRELPFHLPSKIMQPGAFRISATSWRSLPVLVLLFGVSFLIPSVGLYLYFGGGKSKIVPGQKASATPPEARDFLFSEAFSVRAGNTYIRVLHTQEVQPIHGSDFLFALWVKPTRLPQENEELIVVSKVDVSHVLKRGFSISLLREGDQIFPHIWWQSTGGQAGGLKKFAAIEFVPDSWMFLALSFRQSGLLGLHSAVVSEENAPSEAEANNLQLLGGYEVSAEELPSAASDLIIGSRGNTGFRGRIGPMLIAHQEFEEDELDDVLQQLLKQPLSLPAVVETDRIGLWTPEIVKDAGPRHQSVEVIIRGKQKTNLVQTQGVKAVRKKAGKKKQKKGKSSLESGGKGVRGKKDKR